jgi:hypothetical protein
MGSRTAGDVPIRNRRRFSQIVLGDTADACRHLHEVAMSLDLLLATAIVALMFLLWIVAQ